MIKIRPFAKTIPGRGDDAQARAILALYRRLHGPMAAATSRGILAWIKAQNVAGIAAAVQSGNVATVVGAIDFVSLGANLAREMGEPTIAALQAGAKYALETFPQVVTTGWAVLDLDAEGFMAGQGARMVREITAETEKAVRATVLRGYQEGIGPDRLAREVRSSIGLTERQSFATVNFRRRLERAIAEGKPASWVTQRYGLARDVLRPGTMRADRVDALTRGYRDRFVAHRAQNIARTEVTTAVSEGRNIFWTRAKAAGADISTATWYVVGDDRLCEICAPLDGVSIAFGGNEGFTTPTGEVVAFPPAHPSCRCDWRVS